MYLAMSLRCIPSTPLIFQFYMSLSFFNVMFFSHTSFCANLLRRTKFSMR